MVRREYGFVNLVVEADEKQVKIWACNKNGQSVFRLKNLGGEVKYTEEMNGIIVRCKSFGKA